MKHNITLIALLLFMCLLGTASLKAQNSKHLRQANKEFDLHAYNMAIKSYRKVIRKDPDNAKAYIGLGECYRLLGRMNEAADWYKKALQLPDVDPIAIFHYAKTLMALGHYEKAKEWFVTYAEIQPVFGKHFAESCDFAISLRGMPASFRVKKEFVNTEASDFGPAFFNENVVFASARTDLKRKMDKDRDTWDGEAKNQLFISSIDDKGYLSSPSLLLSDLQNEYNLGPLSYSVDGKWVAFAKNNFVNGTRQIPEAGIDGSLFIAEVNPDGSWKDIRPFPHNGSGYASLYPHLSNDGKKLYFASNRPDGFGGFDIYVSFKVGKTWTSPENLGPLVNSQGNELCPYLDGDLLYFSSDWHHGLGGFDIFKAVTEDGIWTKVYHLGNAVNSSYDDYSLIYNSRKGKGYFVSNRKGGKGNEDIYQISKISKDAVILVLEDGTGTSIEGATIDFSDCGSASFTTDETGKYRFQVFDGLECEVMIYKDGFKPAVLNISSKTAHKETYQINLSKVPNMVTGLLFDSRNNQPLNEVHITAQAKDMAPLKTTSNTNGSYQLALTPNTKYIIRYSKAGYLDTHQKIQTGEKVSANLLEPILLIPASTNIEDDTEMVAATPPPKEKEEIKPTPTDTTMDIAAMDTSDSEESSPTETTKTEQAPATTKGYAVQVAALNMKDKVQKDNFAALAAVGNLYTRPQKGMKKVRVGIYHTKEEALQARKNIVAKGFKSAFVVAEEIADPDEIQVILTAPTLQPAAAKAEDKQPKDFPTEKTETESSSIDAIPSIFMVRLATYSRPELFDASKIETLGKLEKRLKGNMTIMLLSGFPTLKAAREASKAAAAKGFKGAHVVIEEDGKLIKL